MVSSCVLFSNVYYVLFTGFRSQLQLRLLCQSETSFPATRSLVTFSCASSYSSFPHITPYNDCLATVPYILKRMKIQHISVQGRKVFSPCHTLSRHFFVRLVIILFSTDYFSQNCLATVTYQNQGRKPNIYWSKVVFHPSDTLSFTLLRALPHIPPLKRSLVTIFT